MLQRFLKSKIGVCSRNESLSLFEEVGRKDLYNLKADVYSWSMLMWYILVLEPPYGSFTPPMIVERVFNNGIRPPVLDSWPTEIATLLKKCWDENIAARPDFTEILKVVKTHLDKLETL